MNDLLNLFFYFIVKAITLKFIRLLKNGHKVDKYKVDEYN